MPSSERGKRLEPKLRREVSKLQDFPSLSPCRILNVGRYIMRRNAFPKEELKIPETMMEMP